MKYVVYVDREPVAVFRYIQQCADYLGITWKSACWLATPSAAKRFDSGRLNKMIVRVSR